MSDDSKMIDLFNQWEQVWHEGKFDLVPSCRPIGLQTASSQRPGLCCYR
jgi:hypothetical protein